MRYTPIHANLSDADLKVARKRDDAELCRLTGKIRALRESKKVLDLEAFRRLHAERIDTVIAEIKADPELRASLEDLRNNKTARALGPRSYSPTNVWPAWISITGRDRLNGDQSPSDSKMVEIVLALIPAGPA